MRKLELLAPAKNLDCGMAAISHGADAVYIGASRFGARAAAGNSVDDIARLCRFAHRYAAKVYVTVNTIIYDDELSDTRQLIAQLADVGADALLVQDMATLDMVPQGLALHASTQCDTRSTEKVRWLRSLGFRRVVLARELSVEEIKAVHQALPDVELETFVHGALCVSYSGQCYASQHLFGRSANRGECAQVCRMKFDLVDAAGTVVENSRYLMSMKDLCLIDHLEELADAGASSFKIEGRLKDVDYVKNVVAAYSEQLDKLIARRPADYCRASWGHATHSFRPNLAKTFNRGYTTYFLHGRQPDIVSMDTPKALGEFVGRVKELRHDSFNVAGTASFANGDGLCFINDSHELEGFRVNRAVGNRLYPLRMPDHLRHGMALYRNNDEAFSKQLAGETARRTMPVDMTFGATPEGFSLTMKLATPDGEAIAAQSSVAFVHQEARKRQDDNIRQQLSRLGNTVYEAGTVTIDAAAQGLFVPSSLLSELRRKAVEALDEAVARHLDSQRKAAARHLDVQRKGTSRHLDVQRKAAGRPFADKEMNAAADEAVKPWQPEYERYPYLYNIANREAAAFYEKRGLYAAAPAFEINEPADSVTMQCRHCLRYTLGFCVRHGGRKPTWKEPLTLRLGDGRRFQLEFRCDECQMNLHPVK